MRSIIGASRVVLAAGLLAAGCEGRDTGDSQDPGTRGWSSADEILTPVSDDGLVAVRPMPDGNVLSIAGSADFFGAVIDPGHATMVGEVRLFDASNGAWKAQASMPTNPTSYSGVVYLPDATAHGLVLVAGGLTAIDWISVPAVFTRTRDTWFYDPVDQVWSAGPPLPTAMQFSKKTKIPRWSCGDDENTDCALFLGGIETGAAIGDGAEGACTLLNFYGATVEYAGASTTTLMFQYDKDDPTNPASWTTYELPVDTATAQAQYWCPSADGGAGAFEPLVEPITHHGYGVTDSAVEFLTEPCLDGTAQCDGADRYKQFPDVVSAGGRSTWPGFGTTAPISSDVYLFHYDAGSSTWGWHMMGTMPAIGSTPCAYNNPTTGPNPLCGQSATPNLCPGVEDGLETESFHPDDACSSDFMHTQVGLNTAFGTSMPLGGRVLADAIRVSTPGFDRVWVVGGEMNYGDDVDPAWGGTTIPRRSTVYVDRTAGIYQGPDLMTTRGNAHVHQISTSEILVLGGDTRVSNSNTPNNTSETWMFDASGNASNPTWDNQIATPAVLIAPLSGQMTGPDTVGGVWCNSSNQCHSGECVRPRIDDDYYDYEVANGAAILSPSDSCDTTSLCACNRYAARSVTYGQQSVYAPIANGSKYEVVTSAGSDLGWAESNNVEVYTIGDGRFAEPSPGASTNVDVIEQKWWWW